MTSAGNTPTAAALRQFPIRARRAWNMPRTRRSLGPGPGPPAELPSSSGGMRGSTSAARSTAWGLHRAADSDISTTDRASSSSGAAASNDDGGSMKLVRRTSAHVSSPTGSNDASHAADRGIILARIDSASARAMASAARPPAPSTVRADDIASLSVRAATPTPLSTAAATSASTSSETSSGRAIGLWL